MSNAEIEANKVMKEIALTMSENGASADEIAKAEIAVQYFMNPEFRKKLNDYVFESTYMKQI